MYPTGWKHTPEINDTATTSNGALYPIDLNSDHTITEFATGLQAPTELIIPCEGFTYCLFALAGDSSQVAFLWDIWGTQTDGEAAQQIKFCLNFRLLDLTGSDTDSGGTGGTVSLEDLPNTNGFSRIVAADQDSGANPAAGDPIGALHFWNRIAGNQTIAGYQHTTAARSGDDPVSTSLWHYPAP